MRQINFTGQQMRGSRAWQMAYENKYILIELKKKYGCGQKR